MLSVGAWGTARRGKRRKETEASASGAARALRMTIELENSVIRVGRFFGKRESRIQQRRSRAAQAEARAGSASMRDATVAAVRA